MTGSAAVAGIQRVMELDDDVAGNAASMRAKCDERCRQQHMPARVKEFSADRT